MTRWGAEQLLAWRPDDAVREYSARDTALYALGVGCGLSDLDETAFVLEERVVALPSMPVVLASDGFWPMQERFGFNWPKILHGEQALVLHEPLAASGRVRRRLRVTGVVDRGPGRGALMYCARELFDDARDVLLATLTETWVMRGDDGMGGAPVARPAPPPQPSGAPNASLTLPTSRQTALIYRLSGDVNPLHADPEFARAAGFERPILHGLATLGVATRALLHLCADGDPARLKSLALRFKAPVYPGEAISTDVWRDGETVLFRARVGETVVLDNGVAQITA